MEGKLFGTPRGDLWSSLEFDSRGYGEDRTGLPPLRGGAAKKLAPYAAKPWTRADAGARASPRKQPLSARGVPTMSLYGMEEESSLQRALRLPKVGCSTCADCSPSAVRYEGGMAKGFTKLSTDRSYDESSLSYEPPATSSTSGARSARLSPPLGPKPAGRRPNSTGGQKTPYSWGWEATPGITASAEEGRATYNAICDSVVQSLDDLLQRFVREHEAVPVKEAKGVYLALERCHSCQVHHRLTTRHQEDQYRVLAEELLLKVRQHSQGTISGVAEFLCTLESQPKKLHDSYIHGQEVWHHASRVGAFEVYLLTPNLQLDDRGTVVTFPERVDADVEAAMRERRTWGAQRVLPGGSYTATLIYSKLCGKSWPTVGQVMTRISGIMPRSSVTVHVRDPSGEGLKAFTVEARETMPASTSPLLPRETSRNSFNRADGDPVHMVVHGFDGYCQIRGLPFGTQLELRVYHTSMRMQNVEFVVSSLKMGFAFGSDIAFRLWAVEIPGGIDICASIPEINPSVIHPSAYAFEGQVEMANGDMFAVNGRMQLPWTEFHPQNNDSPTAFGSIRRFHANGYYCGELASGQEQYTVRQLHQQEYVEISTLAAPRVCLRVVLPACRLPLEGVHVEIPGEQQAATTNAKGICWMVVRQGQHVVRMSHPELTAGSIEQKIAIKNMEPRIQLQLPPQLRVWREPIQIRGVICGWHLWLGSTNYAEKEEWKPYSGELQRACGRPIKVTDGLFSAGEAAVEELDDRTDVRPISPDPIDSLEPSAPFARRVEFGVQDQGIDGLLAAQQAQEPRLLQKDWGPLRLGTKLLPPPQAALPLCTKLCSRLYVHAMTACCGVGVAGVQVCSSREDGETDEDGVFVAPGVVSGSHAVDVGHAALGVKPQRHIVHLPEAGPPGTEPQGPAQLPVVFPSKFYVFCVEDANGGRLVQATGSLSKIPVDALHYSGKAMDNAGEELPHLKGPGERFCVWLKGRHLQQRRSSYMAGLSENVEPCPLAGMILVPDLPGYQFKGVRPPPFSDGTCGIRYLLGDAPLTLGVLKPYCTLVLLRGREMTLKLEEYPRVSHVLEYLASHLHMEGEGGSRSVISVTTSSGQDKGSVLPPEHEIVPGQCLQILVNLEVNVRFGWSCIGIPKAKVVIQGEPGIPAQETDADGCCYIQAPVGPHPIAVSHPLFGGDKVWDVTLEAVHTKQNFSARPCLIVYSVVPDEAAIDPRAASAVWLASRMAHLPAGAKPIAAKMLIRKGDKDREVVLDAENIQEIFLENQSRQTRLEGGTYKSLPCDRVMLAFQAGGHLWCPASGRYESGVGMWLLEDKQAWKALVAGPLCIGQMKPTVAVRCRGLSKGDELVDPQAFNNIAVAASENKTARELCASLADVLGVAAQDLVAFQQHRAMLPEDDIVAWSEVDVWPTAPVSLQIRTRCCGSGVRGMRLYVSEDYGMSGGASSSALDDVIKPGVRVRLPRTEATAAAGQGGERLGVVLTVDATSKLCHVRVSAAGDEQEAELFSVPAPQLRLADPRRAATTDDEGRCEISTTCGTEHVVHLLHTALQKGVAEDASDGRLTRIVPVKHPAGARLDITLDVQLFVYMTGPDKSEPGAAWKMSHVWVCTKASSVPKDAQPVEGKLMVCGSAGNMKMKIGSPFAPLKLPKAFLSAGASADGCPLARLAVDVVCSEAAVWCPKSLASAGCKGCSDLLLGEPQQLGTLKPAITVHRHDFGTVEPPPQLRLPLEDYSSPDEVREWLAEELDVAVADVGLFQLPVMEGFTSNAAGSSIGGDAPVELVNGAGGLSRNSSAKSIASVASVRPLDEHLAMQPGLQLAAYVLAPLTVRVLVPEGAQVGEPCEEHGLQGVQVEMDGEVVGHTNEEGALVLKARIGQRKMRLRHLCFGTEGRTVRDIDVKYGQSNQRVVMADLRILIFASYADEGDDDDMPNRSPREADAQRQVLLWVCASRSQIQGDLVPVQGQVAGLGLDGRRVAKALEPSGITELQLLNGAELEATHFSFAAIASAAGAEATSAPDQVSAACAALMASFASQAVATCQCSLASLDVQASKASLCWRPRDPHPLKDRALEVGGCEFLRLLECPTVIGYLDPCVTLMFSDGSKPEMKLSVLSYPTVSDLKAHLHEDMGTELGMSIDSMLILTSEGQSLNDDQSLEAGSVLTLAETATVSIKVVSGCCLTPVDNVQILADGSILGMTDSNGRVENLAMTTGHHNLEFGHVGLGNKAGTAQTIKVTRGDNAFSFVADPRLHFYATEPEACEEDAEEGEEAEAGVATDPTCVWLAADPAHIPEDALPLRGHVTCSIKAEKRTLRLELEVNKIEPIVMELDGAVAASDAGCSCLLASLQLDCMRKGYKWVPKDPSPLVERAIEIGGCELLRVAACPVCLGFLKPAVTVYCARGANFMAPLEACYEVQLLREYIAERLDDVTAEELKIVFAESNDPLTESAQLVAGANLLCAAQGEKIKAAREIYQQSMERDIEEQEHEAAARKDQRHPSHGAVRRMDSRHTPQLSSQ
eukprot:TRINITY_DN47240_c0_g1_i1.p1 TRINITY_DN47240_c0_g1~~TRINITY_DN47240_c0_g1_i1.p1  ORF type:complete len:2512 (+),score=513.77 TRINITY_DN47240_c0_g1_i1:108-7643(+)